MANKTKIDLSLNTLLTCAFYAVIGLFLVITKAGSLNILMTVVGALFIALGIVDILNKKDLVKAIAEIVIGVAIIVCGWLIVDIVLLVFGIFLLVYGALDLWAKRKASWEALISPIVVVVIGILLIVAKWAAIDTMCLIAGIIFLINAVLVLFGKNLAK